MLRDHPIFLAPIAVNRAGLIDKPWPADWNDPHEGTTIKVLPLAVEEKSGRTPGWCTYTRDMDEAPEIEVFCGGINSKTATAAGLWRQGNLLHYGFDLSPDEMNESGKGDARSTRSPTSPGSRTTGRSWRPPRRSPAASS